MAEVGAHFWGQEGDVVPTENRKEGPRHRKKRGLILPNTF